MKRIWKKKLLQVFKTSILNHFCGCIVENLPPRLNGSSLFEITTGQLNEYHFVANDSDNFTLNVLGGLPGSLVKHGDGTQYTFSVNLASAVNSTVSFYAADTLNATSLLNPHVHMCACQNGNCTLDGVLNRDADPLIMNCICPEGEHKIKS